MVLPSVPLPVPRLPRKTSATSARFRRHGPAFDVHIKSGFGEGDRVVGHALKISDGITLHQELVAVGMKPAKLQNAWGFQVLESALGLLRDQSQEVPNGVEIDTVYACAANISGRHGASLRLFRAS
jgi:hypothetical protein